MNRSPHPALALMRQDIRLPAVALSCLFSLINILATPVLNDDAFGYLRAAELFGTAGIGAVLDNYGWYGYSILIALLDRVTPGGPLAAAHLLNMAAYGLLVYSFISLSAEYRSGYRVKLFAAIVILSFPLINEMRNFLIRDFAFWGFCLAALLQLIRYHRTCLPRHALGWCLAMLAATFFRLEGLVLLALTPLSLLFNGELDRHSRLRGYLLIQGILVAGVALVCLLCYAAGIDLVDLIQYAYRYYLPRIFNLSQLLVDTAGQLNTVIFTPQNFPGNSSHGLVVLLIAYTYTVAVNLIIALGIPFSLLFLYGLLGKKFTVPRHASLPALFFAGASLLSLLIFMFIMHFLTQRYAALAALILISFLPLCLDTLQERARQRSRLAGFRLVFGFFVFYFLVDSLVSFGYSKRYVDEAIDWSRANLPAGNQLYTDSYAIAYFSGLVPEYDKISLDPLHYLDSLAPGDYLAVEADHDELELRALLEERRDLKLVVNFGNERDDQIRIYRMGGEND